MNEKSLQLIGHSLGIDIRHAEMSSSLRDKKLPEEYYRNHYCAGKIGSVKDEDWIALDEMSHLLLVTPYEKFGNQVFAVTAQGRSEFEKIFTERVIDTFVPPEKSKQVYADFNEADTGLDFYEWLGIQLPEYQYFGRSAMTGGRVGYRVRMISTKYQSVKGEYCGTKKAAKASYKIALKRYKNESM